MRSKIYEEAVARLGEYGALPKGPEEPQSVLFRQHDVSSTVIVRRTKATKQAALDKLNEAVKTLEERQEAMQRPEWRSKQKSSIRAGAKGRGNPTWASSGKKKSSEEGSKEKERKETLKWGEDVVSDPFYGRGRHAVDPYIFPEDGSVDVVHEGVLSHMITLHVVPFHEMEEFILPSSIPADQKLASLKANIKAEDKRLGIQRKYTAQQATVYKDAATVCDICGKKFETQSEKHGDHNHKTGEWRGTLCGNCNTGIGMLKDNPEVLEAAAAYLRRSQKFGTPSHADI